MQLITAKEASEVTADDGICDTFAYGRSPEQAPHYSNADAVVRLYSKCKKLQLRKSACSMILLSGTQAT